jgi:hypothetical protein
MCPHKTRRRFAIGAIGVLVLAARAGIPVADEAVVEAAARAAQSASIVVAERYDATSRFAGTAPAQDLPYISLPYADLAARLLRLAEVAILSAPAHDMAITVVATGQTEAVLYDSSVNGQRIRDTTYRSAMLSGTILIETEAGSIERTFAGSIPAPFNFMVTFGYDPYRDPNNAPFREAFEAPGGYADVLARLLGEIYGQTLLDLATKDHDPLVRRAAELAR